MPDFPESVATADAATFERVFAAYGDPLCRFVNSYVSSWETAEDLVDDVFLKLWYRLRQGESVSDLKAYLFTSARNHAISHLRHLRVESRHRERSLGDEYSHPEAVPAAAEDLLAESELTAVLQRAVDLLPPRQRSVVLLKWRSQATNDEVAERLGIASTTVAEHFRRALQQLRVSLPSLQDLR